MPDNEVMTAKDVAEYLKLKERTVNNLAMKGKLPAVKIGRQWRFRKSQIDALFAEGGMANLTD
jgi:excisionase family DNA binding protein